MSIPITTDTDLFPKEGFCPGAGVLAVHVPDEYDFSSHKFEEAVKRSIPACTSYKRPSALFTDRTVTLVYSTVRMKLTELYDAWNSHTGRKDKAPVVNRTYMESWFGRMQMNKDETLAQLGVAQPGDTVDLCVTPKGGRKVVVSTFENGYTEAFRTRCREAYSGETENERLLDALTDVTILSALAEFNRRLIYEQLCHACGWTTVRTRSHIIHTPTSGIDLESWEVFSSEVRVGEYGLFLLPYGKDSWVVCQAPESESNKPVPWKVLHEMNESPLPVLNVFHAKVSVTCMPVECNWVSERNK